LVVLEPLLMLVVYTFFFGTVLKVRWADSVGTFDFAALVFVGMIVHGFFSEVTIRSSSVVAINTSYVKRVVFPLETFRGRSWGCVISFDRELAGLIVFIATTTGRVRDRCPAARGVPAAHSVFAWLLLDHCLARCIHPRYCSGRGRAVLVLMFLAPVFYPATALLLSIDPWWS
jgi:lipopolysaccharide transport system permease protein